MTSPITPRVTRNSTCTSRTSSYPNNFQSWLPSEFFFAIGPPLESGIWLFVHIIQEAGFATSHTGLRLKHAKERLLLSLSQRPINVTIKASLTRRSSIIKTAKKEELWSPDFTTLLGSRIRDVLNTSRITNLFRHSIV